MVSLTNQGEKDGSCPPAGTKMSGRGGFGQVSNDHLVPGQDLVPHDQGVNDHKCVKATFNLIWTQDSSDLKKGSANNSAKLDKVLLT